MSSCRRRADRRSSRLSRAQLRAASTSCSNVRPRAVRWYSPPGRVLVEGASVQQAVSLHRAKGVGQDLRAHWAEQLPELGEPPWSGLEAQDDHRGPLVADLDREGAHRAGRVECRGVGRLLHTANGSRSRCGNRPTAPYLGHHDRNTALRGGIPTGCTSAGRRARRRWSRGTRRQPGARRPGTSGDRRGTRRPSTPVAGRSWCRGGRGGCHPRRRPRRRSA